MKNTGRKGVSAIQSIVYDKLGWTFREQTVDDCGIDAEIEVANQNHLTGKVIAAQIKSGTSYFKQCAKDSITFYFGERHKKYWLKHVLPVIVLLYHPITKECIWEVIDELTVKPSAKGYKIEIPREKQFGVSTKAKLLILAYCKNIEDLAEEIDDLAVDKEALFALLDTKQKEIFLKSREMFNKKNAAAYSVPLEYNCKELFNFVNTVATLDEKNETFIGSQITELISRIENFICNSQATILIIFGEAGVGKTTLVKTFMEKYKENGSIMYVQSFCGQDILDLIYTEYKLNNMLRTIIIDGWDELYPQEKLNIWYKLIDWQNQHTDIKFIITSRQWENNIWENASVLRMYPMSQAEALYMIESLTGFNFAHEESVINLTRIFNTPLMLKMLVTTTQERGIPLEKVTMDNLIFYIVSRYSEEDSQTLEHIAFAMMKENKTIISLEGYDLRHLNKYKELYIANNQISFRHIAFYEIFAAKYIFKHVFIEEKTPIEFIGAVWDVFSNNLYSIDGLNYLKYIIKYNKISITFLEQLNCNFSYMLEQLFFNSTCGETIFKSISNVFYAVWHIVSYTNRIYYGSYKPRLTTESELNLSCIINTFNRVYFGEKYLDFSHTDLSNIRLWRSNLINMNFKHSKLCHSDFLGCCMEGSNFQQADLSYSNLVSTDLRHADLKNAILTGANVSNCMISEDCLEYFLLYKDTLRHVDKLIVFMNDGTIKKFKDN